MIEYPEYLMKTPALASSYLQGDTARFECFQTHWIRGDHEYKCGWRVDIVVVAHAHAHKRAFRQHRRRLQSAEFVSIRMEQVSLHNLEPHVEGQKMVIIDCCRGKMFWC